jgi:hypothetical protein
MFGLVDTLAMNLLRDRLPLVPCGTALIPPVQAWHAL